MTENEKQLEAVSQEYQLLLESQEELLNLKKDITKETQILLQYSKMLRCGYAGKSSTYDNMTLNLS